MNRQWFETIVELHDDVALSLLNEEESGRARILIEIVQGQDMQWCISEVNKRTQKKRERKRRGKLIGTLTF